MCQLLYAKEPEKTDLLYMPLGGDVGGYFLQSETTMPMTSRDSRREAPKRGPSISVGTGCG